MLCPGVNFFPSLVCTSLLVLSLTASFFGHWSANFAHIPKGKRVRARDKRLSIQLKTNNSIIEFWITLCPRHNAEDKEIFNKTPSKLKLWLEGGY